jgi:lipoate synthase
MFAEELATFQLQMSQQHATTKSIAIMKCCPRITILLMIAELNNYKRRCKYCNLQEANMNMHDREERTVETHQTVFFIP